MRTTRGNNNVIFKMGLRRECVSIVIVGTHITFYYDCYCEDKCVNRYGKISVEMKIIISVNNFSNHKLLSDLSRTMRKFKDILF